MVFGFGLSIITILSTSFCALVWHVCLDIILCYFLVLACLPNFTVSSVSTWRHGPAVVLCLPVLAVHLELFRLQFSNNVYYMITILIIIIIKTGSLPKILVGLTYLLTLL